MTITASLLDVKFVLLLFLIGLLRSIWPSKHYVLFGVLASAAALSFAAPTTFVTIAAITLGFLFPLHRLMWTARERSWPRLLSSSLLLVGIGGMVALLVAFKLHRYFTVPWLGGAWIREDVAALIGFSYFIFRAISFLHIQSILRFKESKPWTLLFYTLFPPTLTSGPIQKFQDFRQQMDSPAPLTGPLIGTAVYRITRGYFRKMVVAYVLNEFVAKLLLVAQPTAVTSIAIVALLYLFFYYDFAGYSDIAIGFGLLIGIRVPENFRKPFLATTVSEFWRNWHITLVDWFRDQLFIPLGGMRDSRIHAAFLAFFIMVLCGLWHGLTLSFLAWGVWHGTMLFTEAVFGVKPIPPALRHGTKYWLRVLWTNARVAFGAIFFLPDSDAIIRLLRGFITW
jgi:alginate O-acetyltransferase complex protein AlgI